MSPACTTPWPADGRNTGGRLFGHAAAGPRDGAYREDWHPRYSEARAARELEIGHSAEFHTPQRGFVPQFLRCLKRRLCRVVFNRLRYTRRQQSDPA